MRKTEKIKLDTNIQMSSNKAIVLFTIIGITFYLLTFLSIIFFAPKPMASWKIFCFGIGGSIIVGALIIIVLRICGHYFNKEKGKNRIISK